MPSKSLSFSYDAPVRITTELATLAADFPGGLFIWNGIILPQLKVFTKKKCTQTEDKNKVDTIASIITLCMIIIDRMIIGASESEGTVQFVKKSM